MAAVIYLVLIAAVFFFLVVRPQRRQIAAHRALVASLAVGDEVISSGGIYGTIRRLDDTSADLEIAPGVTIKVARSSVSQRAPRPAADGAGD